MASQIAAVNAYCPKIKLGRTAGTDELVEFIARSTGLNESGVRQVLLELRDALISFNRQGRAVKLEGLGTYTPAIGLDGVIKIGHRADTALKSALNQSGAFRGEILNRETIGQTHDDLIARWNGAHPDDLVG